MIPTVAKVKKVTEEEKHHQEHLQEQELCKLRREYIILEQERARSQYTGWTKMAKATKVVNIFKNEYENILNDLAVATAPAKQKRDVRRFDHLTHLLEQYDFYSERVNTEKTYMVEVEGQIKKVAKDVHVLRKQQITDRQYEDRVHAARNTLETLENKLEVQTTKFNQIVAKNRELREDIDHCLWDRRNFMRVWKRLIDKLNTGKHIMLDLIEQASIAYDQREEWCNKLQLLRITGHKDLLMNIDQMRRYNQRVDNAIKLQEFFNTKGQKRVMRDLELKEKLKRAELKKKLEEKLKHYETMMEDIMMFCSESEVEVIARRYYKREAENFMRFQFVIDLISQMEEVNDQLGYLCLHIDEQRALQAARAEQQRFRLESLEEDLGNAQGVTHEAEKTLEEHNAKLDEMMQGIHHLFKLCRCDMDPLLQLLGDNSTIRSYNVLLYLQMLEKTIHSCLVRAGFRDKTLAEKKPPHKEMILSDEPISTKIYSIEKIVPAHPCALCVEHEMVSDVFDCAQRAWSKREAKHRLQQRLEMPDGLVRVHKISKCQLPQARHILQQRYE
ncbi:coiled-coil domain-containing protein 63-like isoform X1 [Tenebrio molitor]|uniref:coiled-coil domain-containing protein 63-like isoform X1 n=2 Tax=Tenebrio molitor TaxID=7067 RepID=UPI0036247A8F